MRVARLLTTAAALIVCAWFALGIHQANDTRRATKLIAAGGRGQLAHAASLIRSASPLNPDRTLDLLRVELALAQGRTSRARALAHRLVRAEPMNVSAWLWYGRASGGNPAIFLTALAHAHELDPLPLRR
jgi:hypothetical protein